MIACSSLYGAEQLRLSQSQLITTVLLVQFVAFGGALLLRPAGPPARRQATVLDGLVLWPLVVVFAFFAARGRVAAVPRAGGR